MRKLDLSLQQFNDAVIHFNKTSSLNQHKRLGQYIHETYIIDGAQWPELYYEENDNSTIGMLTVECIMHPPVEDTVVDPLWMTV